MPPTKTPPSQTRWKAANVVSVKIDISKNRDPELYELFSNIQGSRGTVAKQMLYEALNAKQQKETTAE